MYVGRARRTVGVLAAVAIASTGAACDRGGDREVREVIVDYGHDEFATSMVDFFPDVVRVHAGATIRFRQSWTGEPHSVTFGASFNDELGEVRERLAASPPPDAAELAALAMFDELPAMLGREGREFVVNQNGAQPCYLEEGAPPADPDTPCPERAQPTFTGRHAYYSSGFIRYRGEGSNTFEMTLADDIAPGSYHYYCNLHGVGQSGTIEVVGADGDVPSRAAVEREAYERMQSLYTEPLQGALDAGEQSELAIDGRALPTPLAGVAEDDVRPWGGLAHRRHFGHRHGSANEFVPREIHAKVGEPVTWTFVGRHTISFNVPRYLPVFEVGDDGSVVLDPRVHEPVGWPGRPPGDAAAHVDAGTWDGRGFRSTGLDWRTGDTFTVRFAKRGTFAVACLVHPRMVGAVRVR